MKKEFKRFSLIGISINDRKLVLLSESSSFYVVYRHLLSAQSTGKYRNLQINDNFLQHTLFIV